MGLTIYTIPAQEQWEEDVDDMSFIQRIYPELKEPKGVEMGSEEMGWSWWEEMQNRVSQAIGKENATHTLACQAWTSAYMPFVCEPHELHFPSGSKPIRRNTTSLGERNLRKEITSEIETSLQNKQKRSIWERLIPKKKPITIEVNLGSTEETTYQIASLHSLLRELYQAAKKLRMPNAPKELTEWLKQYEQEGRYDDDPDLQCLAQTLIVGQIAAHNDQPLWVVK